MEASFLLPGKDFTFPATLTASAPVGILEEVIVFGSTASTQLNDIIDDKFEKLQSLVAASRTTTADWIAVGLPIKVKVNNPFKNPVGDIVDKREYTIPKFDIRPYLPDDKGTALYRALQEANWLANYPPTSGVRYHQGWDASLDDKENLKHGIDCSRAIWFAFRRANLPYNHANAYLSTADMLTPKSLMNDDFDRVSIDGTFRIGDILVYRNDEKDVGHVVMVIDQSERIAWGSHGFDGRIRTHEVSVPETGVQYQKIRYKPDWKRWDRVQMSLKACWRYRQFARDFEMPGGHPGLRSLSHACDQASCTD
jgi:hypothetical protein